MAVDERLRRARTCFEHASWLDATELFSACDAESGLLEDDLERLAVAAFLVGENETSDQAWTRAHRRHLRAGDRPGAVRCAFWLVLRLLNAGELPSASGWLARTERILGEATCDSVERAQLGYLAGLHAVFTGDLATAERELERSAAVAQRCAVSDVTTLARLALGRVRIFRGDVVGGVRLLDEAMVSVLAGETSPIVVGDGFCTAIDACHDVVDVRRGQAWTAAFGRWCDTQPDLVAFAGVCLVHRAEFLQLTGAWVKAVAQAGLARARLSAPVAQVALGGAIYQQGELHRLCGRADEAERCYREASAHGRDPQPGLALLRLAQGHTGAAARGLERALAESVGEVGRPQLLAAQVEVALAVGDVPSAQVACEQLAGLARSLSSPMLAAVLDRATGALELAEGDAARALAPLRRAGSGFRSLGATYEVARTGVLISRARRALADEEGAALEEAASRSAFTALGASADLAELGAGTRGRQARHQRSSHPDALTDREVQVLGLVARGSTNREIGVELGLSERTVDRHVSNILGKLGVSSRAAATATAYEHHLL